MFKLFSKKKKEKIMSKGTKEKEMISHTKIKIETKGKNDEV